MPRTNNAATVSASRNVCVRVFVTLSSTKATLAERSVIEFKRLTLIIARQLLSGPGQLQWPSRHDFAHIFRIEPSRVDFDLSKRIENLDRDFELLRQKIN